MRKIFLIIYCLLFAYAEVYSQDISELLPDSAGVWKKYDSSNLYIGDDLFTLIDGGADIYHEYGFVKVITQRYESDERYIDVEIYEMKDSSAAFGIFSLQTFKTGKRIQFASGASLGDGFLIFWKGDYYVTLSTSDASKEASDNLMVIAGEIHSRISPAGIPDLAARFNNSINSNYVYLKGYLAVYNLYLFGTGNIFNVNEGIHFEDNHGKNFVFRYLNEQDTKMNYRHSDSTLKSDKSLEFLSGFADSYLYKENNGNFILVMLYKEYILVSISGNEKDLDRMSAEIKTILK